MKMAFALISYILVATLYTADSYEIIDHTGSTSFGEAAKSIQKHLETYKSKTSDDICALGMPCCYLSNSEGCDLSSMPRDSSTIVLPGGDTRCIYSSSSPFAFQVIPGDIDKVMIYFQGGGACWDELSNKAGFCTTDCTPQRPDGIFSRDDDRNEFKDYTIVHAMYCSGDVWAGNVTRSYNDANGKPVVQVGYLNGEATLDWVISQQQKVSISSIIHILCMNLYMVTINS